MLSSLIIILAYLIRYFFMFFKKLMSFYVKAEQPKKLDLSTKTSSERLQLEKLNMSKLRYLLSLKKYLKVYSIIIKCVNSIEIYCFDIIFFRTFIRLSFESEFVDYIGKVLAVNVPFLFNFNFIGDYKQYVVYLLHVYQDLKNFNEPDLTEEFHFYHNLTPGKFFSSDEKMFNKSRFSKDDVMRIIDDVFNILSGEHSKKMRKSLCSSLVKIDNKYNIANYQDLYKYMYNKITSTMNLPMKKAKLLQFSYRTSLLFKIQLYNKKYIDFVKRCKKHVIDDSILLKSHFFKPYIIRKKLAKIYTSMIVSFCKDSDFIGLLNKDVNMFITSVFSSKDSIYKKSQKILQNLYIAKLHELKKTIHKVQNDLIDRVLNSHDINLAHVTQSLNEERNNGSHEKNRDPINMSSSFLFLLESKCREIKKSLLECGSTLKDIPNLEIEKYSKEELYKEMIQILHKEVEDIYKRCLKAKDELSLLLPEYHNKQEDYISRDIQGDSHYEQMHEEKMIDFIKSYTTIICSKCKANPKNVIIKKCGHTFCKSCLKDTKLCYICQTAFDDSDIGKFILNKNK